MFWVFVLCSIAVIVDKSQADLQNEKVKVQIFYESLCGACREFYTTSLRYVYNQLHESFDIQTYPYGFAETIISSDGTVDFKCQHGPRECYGNMLHACAIDTIGNFTKALEFNTCMMEKSNPGKGSNDPSAEKCGNLLKVNSQAIIECAKCKKGADLVKGYGEESYYKVSYDYIPYVFINGEVWHQEVSQDFMLAVCEAYAAPPPPCVEYLAQNNLT